jgi:uncharacterized protein YjlB
MEPKYTITENHFTTEEQALAEIAAKGWHAVTRDSVGVDDALHWHDFDIVAFIVSGTASATLEDGRVISTDAGSRVEIPAGTAHHDGTPGCQYRAVVGFSVSPSAFTQPINKPLPVPSQLPSAA